MRAAKLPTLEMETASLSKIWYLSTKLQSHIRILCFSCWLAVKQR